MSFKVLLSYGIGVAAAAVSFLLALNIRSIVLMAYRVSMVNQGRIAWGDSAVNAIAVILLMVGWVIYIFYTQNYFEKKVESKQQYIKASLKLLLPVFLSYIATELFFYFLMI